MQGTSVVIIGAGVVGAAIADELSAKGWDSVTVVDQGRLPKPGGSSSHAPGMVFQHHASPTMSKFAQSTVEKFSALSYEGEPGFDKVGGLEIATTPERLADLRRRLGWAQAQGLEARLVDPEECARLHPLINPAKVCGGLHFPNDGAARAVAAVNAQLSSARQRGVRIIESCTVTDIRTQEANDQAFARQPYEPTLKVIGVDTDHGPIDADLVVCCAGIWGPKIAAMAGDHLPMTTVEHQVAHTSPVPKFAGHTDEATTPMLRHMDAGLYYRDRFDRLEIGSFAHRPIVVDVNEILGPDEAPIMPSMHPFTPADFTPQWAASRDLMPVLEATEVDEGYNGLMAFTQDDFPLLGPSPRVDGMWYAEAVWVTQSAGVGLAMAEWLTDGYSSSFDLSSCELSRFAAPLDSPRLHRQRDVTRYVEVYDIAHPQDSWKESRNLRTSPFYSRECELGAVFGEAQGWERPLWYESNAPAGNASAGSPIADFGPPNAASPGADYSGWTAQNWSPAIGVEARAARTSAALVDLTPLIRLSVRGRDAASLLARVTSARMPRPLGSVSYALILDPGGRIRSDVTITRLGEDEYLLGANSPRDLGWLRRHSCGLDVSVIDITPGTACIGLWGPRAGDIVSTVPSSIDVSESGLRYFRAAQGWLADAPVTCQRVSYIGEFGWEIIMPADSALHVWDTLSAAGQQFGLRPIGRSAVDSLRLEVGFRAFGTDMTSEHTPREAGLDFALSSRDDYIGAGISSTPTQRLVTLVHDDGHARILGGEPVHAQTSAGTARTVGRIASASYSFTRSQSFATAWVLPEYSSLGTALTISAFDTDRSGRVTEDRIVTPRVHPTPTYSELPTSQNED